MTPNAPLDIIVHVFGRTDVGRTREHNEDCFVVADLTTMNATLQPRCVSTARRARVVVHGGRWHGRRAAGEIASQMATEVVLEGSDARWRRADATDAERVAMALRAAVETVNTRIHKYAIEHREPRDGHHHHGGRHPRRQAVPVPSGRQSRLPRARRHGHADHQGPVAGAALIDAGELTPEEAEVSERRNIILQALGPEANVKVDVTVQQLRRGDTLVLCSDGMSGQMRTADISRIIGESPDLVSACKSLIDLANENGGPDNITVITARFEGDGLQPPDALDSVGHRPYVSPSDARPTMPVDAGDVRKSLAALDELKLSKVPTAEVEVQRVPEGYDSGDFVPRRETTPLVPEPVAGRTQRLSVTQMRLIFGSITLVVGAWLAWLYLLRA